MVQKDTAVENAVRLLRQAADKIEQGEKEIVSVSYTPITERWTEEIRVEYKDE